MKDLTQCVVTPKINATGFEALGAAVHRGSTIVFKDADAYTRRAQGGHDSYSYGLYGTPTTRALEAKLTALEQGVRTFLLPSGQAANAIAILPFVQAGDKVLIVDSVYPPVRDFAHNELSRFGVEVEFYDALAPADLERRIDERTKIVWCESPGSTSMEIQDLRRITEIAHRLGALVACDNTWATPLYCKPLTLGADIVTEALTKYISGHSDLLMGSLTVASDALIAPIRATLGRLGIGVSPDDASFVLRGIETLGVRLNHSALAAKAIIEQIRTSPLVAEVLYPALPGSPSHALWKRDFLGASGVFTVVFKPEAATHLPPALDVLRTFAIGPSWGGTRSLMAPIPIAPNRTLRPWTGSDPALRVSVGLEDPADLRVDIENLFAAIAARMA